MTLFVDLSDGFAIGNVNVAPKIKLTSTRSQSRLGQQSVEGALKILASPPDEFRNTMLNSNVNLEAAKKHKRRGSNADLKAQLTNNKPILL